MQGNKPRARAFLELGDRAELSGDAGGALGWYDAARRADPALAPAHLKRCSLLRRAGRHAEALEAAAEFSAALPGEAAARHEAGLCLLALHRTAEAAEELGRAVALDPARRDAWRSLGVALGKLGRTGEAFGCFDRADGREPPAAVSQAPTHRCPELSRAVHDHMADLLDGGPALSHVAADVQFTFKAAVAVLGFLLRDYDMDGVVVAVARPAQAYRQALERRVSTTHPPAYVEVAAPPVAAPLPGAGGRPGAPAPLSAFEPDRIAASVRAALSGAAARYGGEEHFVLMDDLASMGSYNGTEVVRRFSAGLFGEMTGLGIFPFVVLPDDRAQLLGPTPFAPRRRLRVEGDWLAEA